MFRKQKSKNGLDIDVRFLLANERTLLAWVRTGLALIGGGVAVAFIATDSRYGTLAGIGAITFGAMMCLIGYIRYLVTDRAVRDGKLPPTGIGGLLVVVGVIIFAVFLLLARHYKWF
jgi:putative membrane protein